MIHVEGTQKAQIAVYYQNYINQKEYFENCLGILSEDNEFCKQLLQAGTYNTFLQKLSARLESKQKKFQPEYINSCLELALYFDKPLPAYKPKINLELEKIEGIVKPAVVVLWFSEKTISMITQKPFGGRWHWFKHKFTKGHHSSSHKPQAINLNNLASPEVMVMKEKFNRLGDQLWRQHIDWEDQEFGQNVYDEGLHGGDVELGYIESALQAHEFAGRMLGMPLGIEEYEQLFFSGRRHVQKSIRYDTTPRNLWRLKALLEPDVHADMDPEHIRYIPHYHWEVMAFNYLREKYSDIFMKDNLLIANYLYAKYGENIKITKKLLDKEFMRCQINFFNEYHTDVEIRHAINKKLAEFYKNMGALGFDMQMGQVATGNEEAGLLEIAKLTRWLEILHPFIGGNTRHNIILLNKLLIEAGFCPIILSNRNDAPYRSARGWMEQILTGMLRWSVVCGLINIGLFVHLLQIKPGHCHVGR